MWENPLFVGSLSITTHAQNVIVFGSMFYKIYFDCDLFSFWSWTTRFKSFSIRYYPLQIEMHAWQICWRLLNGAKIRRETWHKYRLNDETIRDKKKTHKGKLYELFIFFNKKESFDSDSTPLLLQYFVICCFIISDLDSDTRKINRTWCKIFVLPPKRSNIVTTTTTTTTTMETTSIAAKSPLRQIVNVIPLWNMAIHNKQSNDLSFHT